MGFSEKVQKLRKENNMSQEQLALQLNVSRQAISKWEMGTIPDIKNVVKISSFFDCSLDYLMSEDDDNEDSEYDEKKGKNFSPKKNLKYRDIFVIVGMTVPIISMVVIHILSKAYPLPIVRKSLEGGYVGVNGFIDYYSLQTWIWVLLSIFLISLFTYCLLPIRKSFYKKKKMDKKFLCIVVTGFFIIAFLSSMYCWELVNKPIIYYSAVEIILILGSILIAVSMIKTGRKRIGE